MPTALNLICRSYRLTFPEFASMQYKTIEVVNEIIMNFLLSLISSLDLKPLFVAQTLCLFEANLESVYLGLISKEKLKYIHMHIKMNLLCFLDK